MVDDLHRQRVLNFLDVFSTGDIEGALACCTDDIEFFANAPIDILPHMGHHHGKAELREMWETVHARYSGMRYEVPILVAEADKVAANIRVFFRKSSNDRIVQFDMAAFYTLRDGRIAKIREGLTPREWARAGALAGTIVILNVAGWGMMAAGYGGFIVHAPRLHQAPGLFR